MSAIEATTRTCKTMSDGTLRLSIDISPIYAQEAFSLFGMPDVPMAIARLTLDSSKQAARDEIIESEKPKGGALAKLAGMWCSEPKFWEWLETSDDNCCHSPSGAAACIYGICGISSRAELDNDPIAEEKFHRLIRVPYSQYIK